MTLTDLIPFTHDEFTDLMKDNFPSLCRGVGKPPTETCMCFGFSVDVGWRKIVWDLAEQIEPFCKEIPELFVMQVKEKFGGLRFYMSLSHDKADEFISVAERLSFKTCEACGEPGEERPTSWISTLCDQCYDEHEKWLAERRESRRN